MSARQAKKVPEHEVIIRLAKPSEAAAISSLIREAFAPFETEYTAEAFAYTRPDAEAVRARFDEGPIWVAEIDGSVVGTVSGLPEADRFYIRSMAIKPAAQRLGIGQKLLTTLEAHARERRHEKLYLYTTFVLPAARHLYEKNGFYVLRETLPEEWCNMAGLEMEKVLAG